MKIILALVLVGMIFVPSTAFGWKSLSSLYEPDCDIVCNHLYSGTMIPMNFILLVVTAFAGLGLYYKFTKVGRYETFSLKCKKCGQQTNGLKCPYCETKKQNAM